MSVIEAKAEVAKKMPAMSRFDPERTCPAIARSSAGTLPKSVCNLEMMSLPTSALAGERFTQTRTLH
jgi:hypothetical protein